MKQLETLFRLSGILLGMCVAACGADMAGRIFKDPAPGLPASKEVRPLRLVTLDPGHFHAALLHNQMWPGVAETVHVYAPLGPELVAHLDRISQFNSRAKNPTTWKLEVHAGPSSLERLVFEQPGEVVILSGKNRAKIDRIGKLVSNGFHVLADKPWILEPEDLPTLRAALDLAERSGLAVYDAMTQRFEITCLLQRELVNDREVFGEILPGTAAEPAAFLESVHYLFKEVAGAPIRRPPWFFDIHQQGEGLTDVGTHLVDLVQWILFPDQAIDCEHDIHLLSADRWPTLLSPDQFCQVTGQVTPTQFAGAPNPGQAKADKQLPDSASMPLPSKTPPDSLEYYANNAVLYTLRNIHVALRVRWDFAAPPGAKDTETAIFRGSLSRVEVRQGEEENFTPEVYIVPNTESDLSQVRRSLKQRVTLMQGRWPGIGLAEQPGQFRFVIPQKLRLSHEEHFGLLTRQFLQYARAPHLVPKWERPNMISKYYVTTKGVELARPAPISSAPAAKGR